MIYISLTLNIDFTLFPFGHSKAKTKSMELELLIGRLVSLEIPTTARVALTQAIGCKKDYVHIEAG